MPSGRQAGAVGSAEMLRDLVMHAIAPGRRRPRAPDLLQHAQRRAMWPAQRCILQRHPSAAHLL